MRTLDEVQATLQIAKLNVDDMKPVIHCLSFGENISSGDYCLMELDDTLCKHIEAGKSLVIRGDKDEHAVLCSEDKTYDLKIADTSNLLLFIPDCKTPDHFPEDLPCQNLIPSQISGFSSCYWELRRCRPKVKKLKKLLMDNTYEGPDSENERNSTEQMVRMISFPRCTRAHKHRDSGQNYTVTPSTYRDNIFTVAGDIYFALNEDKVCRATAQMLLQNAVKFNLSEFQEVWQQSVPEGMTTRLDQLKGLALVDRSSRPETIFLLKVEDLPEDTQERFNCLFGMREKWTEEAVAPYIRETGEEQEIKTMKDSMGHVELTIFPTVTNLNRIKLNSKQCRIYRVRVNDLEAPFIYNDPTLEVCHHESKQRNLNYFSNAYAAAVSAVDPDSGNGELCIKVPSELWKQGDELKVLKVYNEFSLNQPKGGLHFVVPDVEGSMAERSPRLLLWIPKCNKLEFTVDAAMVAVSCGDLVETVYTHDMRKKTYHYMLPIPTAAPNISLAVGPFEILLDPYMHEDLDKIVDYELKTGAVLLHTIFAGGKEKDNCLRAIRILQKNGHIPSDPSLFKSSAEYGHFVDVRLAALEAVVDYTQVDRSSEELQWLLNMVQNDPVPYIRHKILSMLAKNPPFTKMSASSFCNEALVDQLWKLMNSGERATTVNVGGTQSRKKGSETKATPIADERRLTTVGHRRVFQEDEHLASKLPCSAPVPQQGMKRKAETPLGSPLEPGQILEKEEDSSKVRLKIRFSNSQEEEDTDMDTVHDSQAFIYHHLNMLETPAKGFECTKDRCGESRNEENACHCSEDCMGKGDCCTNYGVVCKGDTHWVEDECEEIKSPECPAGFVRPPLVIISVDGFRASYMMKGSNVIPNIDKLRSCGTHSPYMRPVYPTKTFPNLYTLATGLYPESHGIVGNSMHDPVFDANFNLRGREKLNHRWWGGQPTIFLGYGPTFKHKTKVPAFENIELYNVMCGKIEVFVYRSMNKAWQDLLGLKPAPNNGTHGSLNHLLKNPPFKPSMPDEIAKPLHPVPASAIVDELGCTCDEKNKGDELNQRLANKGTDDSKHLLYGRPAVLFRTKYSILYHSDFISGYNDALSMPLWTSYTVTKQADVSHIPDSLSSCVRPDIRVPPANSQTCSAYKADKQMSYGYLYPPQLASSPEARYDAFLITNAVPMYPAFKSKSLL
ncbi:UNVERIFIED_CONTAM: hypothetical protein FKN15_060643 [Acipenser sinensis]